MPFFARLSAPVIAVSLIVGAIVSTGRAQAPARTPIDISTLGPQVGAQVPDFSLSDQNGKLWTRQSILGPKGAMLVFIRSADW